jgi:hypothetical protein
LAFERLEDQAGAIQRQRGKIKEVTKSGYMMSPLLEKVLTEVAQLDQKEQLQLVSHLVNRWQLQESILPVKKFSRKDLFGCMQGKIKIAEDFNAPLSDFAEYM